MCLFGYFHSNWLFREQSSIDILQVLTWLKIVSVIHTFSNIFLLPP